MIPVITAEGDDLRAAVGLPDDASLRAVDPDVAWVVTRLFATASRTQNRTAVLVEPCELLTSDHTVGRPKPSAIRAVWLALVGDEPSVSQCVAIDIAHHAAALQVLRHGRPPATELLAYAFRFAPGCGTSWSTTIRAQVFSAEWATVVAEDWNDTVDQERVRVLLGFVRRAELLRGVGTILASNESCWAVKRQDLATSQPPDAFGFALLECLLRHQDGNGLSATYRPTDLATELIAAPEPLWRELATSGVLDRDRLRELVRGHGRPR